MATLKINYNSNTSELCEIGKKYDTDKSCQRKNVTDLRHCHPYTLFYDNLFRSKRNDNINIAEIGILYGRSLLMWREYFPNANIYGFEYRNDLIQIFTQQFNNDRITLSNIDVASEESIRTSFQRMNVMYDIIIEDSNPQFEDQIRAVKNSYQFLKPGGILIVEDIFKSYDEKLYIDRLKHILNDVQDYYFIELYHTNKNSIGWDNDKLFVLVKGGDEPIFKNTNKMTIITPSYRTDNLFKIKNSINFNYVDQWIIVYDGSKIRDNPNIFKNENNDKINEFVYNTNGSTFGNAQRNYALTKISNPNTMVYYLDDDNIINPHIYRLLNIVDNTKMYTFNQFKRLKGNNVSPGYIDTACLLIPYNLCNDISWVLNKYEADGIYILDCYNKNKNVHTFVDNDLCYYNYLTTKIDKISRKQAQSVINNLQAVNRIPLKNKSFMKGLF